MKKSFHQFLNNFAGFVILISFTTTQVLPHGWAVEGIEYDPLATPEVSASERGPRSQDYRAPSSLSLLPDSPLSATDISEYRPPESASLSASEPVLIINSGTQETNSRVVTLNLTPHATQLPGDANQDGSVDLADSVLIRKQMGKVGSDLAEDFNANGIVDGADRLIWQANFGRSLEYLPGDFNKDNSVDLADYTFWRNQDNRFQVDYNIWRANFGKTNPITQMSTSFDGINWLTDVYQASKTLTLPEGQGLKTVYVKVIDSLGNESRVYSDSIVLDLGAVSRFPQIEFLSPKIVSNSNYELIYSVDNLEFRENFTLKEGANLLNIERETPSGKIVINYLVILNGLPNVNLSNSELSFNLELEGESAVLLNPNFNTSGILENGWVKLGNSSYRIENGNIIEELLSDNSRIFYDSIGRIHSKVTSDLKVTNYTYLLDSSNQVTKTLIQSGEAKAILDIHGHLNLFQNEDATIYFDQGLVVKIVDSEGSYEYRLSQAAEGFKSELVSSVPQGNIPYPKEFHYNANHQLIQTTKRDGTNYHFNLLGFLDRVTDKDGKLLTDYSLEESTAGLFQSFVASRDGLTRKFGSDGSLKELITSDGARFTIEGNQVKSIQKLDGTVYDELVYESGVLQNFHVRTVDQDDVYFVNQEIIRIRKSNGTTTEYQDGKPTSSRSLNGEVYQYVESADVNGLPIFTAHLIEFVNQEGNRVFLENGRAVRIEERMGDVVLITTFTYDEHNRISEAEVTENGVFKARFQYVYHANGTQVTNSLNVIRYYNNQNELIGLVTEAGEEYKFTPFQDPQGHTRFLQTLIRIVNNIGTIDYIDGKPVQVTRPDSIVIKNIVLNSNGSLKDARIEYPEDNRVGMIKDGELKEVLDSDGTKKEYSGGLLRKITHSNLKQTEFTYTRGISDDPLLIHVHDELGERTYTFLGSLLRAKTSDGTLFEYDHRTGNLLKITTSTNEEFNYKNGVLTSVRNLITNESLTDIALDSKGNLSAGIYHELDGSIWKIENGKLTELLKADVHKFYFDPQGHVTQIKKADGDIIFYDSSGKITRIERINTSTATQITTNTQDELIINAVIYSPSFNGVILDPIFNLAQNERRIENQILKAPGTQTAAAADPVRCIGTNPNPDRNGCADRWDISFPSQTANDSIYYLRVKFEDSSSSSTTVRFRGPNGSLEQNYQLRKGYNYIPIPQKDSKGNPFKFNSIDFTNYQYLKFDESDLPAIYSKGDYLAVELVTLASQFFNQKIAPDLPQAIGSLIEKLESLNAASNGFKSANVFNSTNTSEDEFLITSIKDSVMHAKLPPSTVIKAIYDESMDLVSTHHADISWNPLTDPRGNWKNSILGWEEVGFGFHPVVTKPSDETLTVIGFTSDGEVAEARAEEGGATHYQNGQVQTVVTPDGRVIRYQFSNDPNRPGVNRIIIDGNEEDPSAFEIIYEYDRIREIKKDGVIIYRYRYEFDQQNNEITVVEDILAKEERRFLGEKLLSVFGLTTGFLTTYTYDSSGRIAEAIMERAGRVFGRYIYTYEGTDTIIQDDENTRRRYGQDGVLKQIRTSKGELYNCSLVSDEVDGDLILQELAQIVNTLKGTIDYVQGRPVNIVTPSGIEIRNLVLDEDNKIESAVVKFPLPDGRTALIENGQVFHITAPGGVLQDFNDGYLETWIDQNGNITLLTYTKDDTGTITTVTVKDLNGIRVYTKGGILIHSELPDKTKFDFDLNGKISRIETPLGEIFEYKDGILKTIIFPSGGGRIDSINLNSDGSLKAGIYAKDGLIYTIENGYLAQKKERDGTTFIYDQNGKVKEIHKPVPGGTNRFFIGLTGTLTKIIRWDGSIVTQLTTTNQDELVDAVIYSPSFNGVILDSTFDLNQNERRMASQILKAPGTQTVVASNPVRCIGKEPRPDRNGCADRWDLNLPPLTASDSVYYLRVNYSGWGSGDQILVRFRGPNGSIEQVYQFQVGYNYIPIPQKDSKGNPFQLSSVDFTATNFQYIKFDEQDVPVVYSKGDNILIEWTQIAKGLNKIDAPQVPSLILETLARRIALESQANHQFSLPSPPQIDQGVAKSLYDQAQAIVKDSLLPNDQVIASVYRKSDGELVTAVKADFTVSNYTNGQIDNMTDRDGNLLIDYHYEGDDLIGITIHEARESLYQQNQKAQNDIIKAKQETLLKLAIERGNGVDQITSLLNQALAQISSERQRLIELSRQKQCTNFIFFKKCRTIEIDISGPLSNLDALERDAREQASEQLAALDTAVKEEKDRIEIDSEKALRELEKQRAATYREILLQELRPVVFHFYRKVLGRDPSAAELDEWLTKEISNQDLTLSSLRDMGRFHGVNISPVWSDFEMLRHELADSPEGLLIYLTKPNGEKGYAILSSINGDRVTFVQKNLGGRNQDFLFEWIEWQDQNGNPIKDIHGNPIFIRKFSFVENEESFGGEVVTKSTEEFLNLWLTSNQKGIVLTHLNSGNEFTPLNDAEISQLKEPHSWDLVTEFFSRVLNIDSEKINARKLEESLRASDEYGARFLLVNQVKENVRTFLKNGFMRANQEQRIALLSVLGLTESEVITISELEIDTILAWLDGQDLHFGHSAFYAIKQLIEEAGQTISLFDIAREAILIDVLTGIIHPLSSGALEISLYALKKVAQNHGISLSAAEITFDELKRELGFNKGILVHVDGNHYVVVTKIETVQKKDERGQLLVDDDNHPIMIEQVTFLEKNVGPQGEAVTVSKEEFLKMWSSTSSGEGVVLTPIQVAEETLMSGEETKFIQGAGAIFLPVLGFILGAIFSTIAAVVAGALAAVAAIVTAITTLVAGIVTAIAEIIITIGQGLITLGQYFFSGVKFISEGILKGLFTGFSFLKTSLAHFGKFLFLPVGQQATAGVLSPVQLIARQVIGVAASVGSGKVLDKLGISPVLSRMSSALLTGGIVGLAGGLLGGSATFIGSSLQALAIQGANELALHLSLAPPIANALSLITGTLAGTITDPASLPTAFQNIAPTIAQEFVYSGFTNVGAAFGLNPQFARIIGSSVTSLIGDSFTNQFIKPSDLPNLIRNAFISGAISIGVGLGLDALDTPPIASSFIVSFLNSIGAQNIYSKIGEGITKFGKGFSKVVGNVISFGQKIIQGIGNITAQGFKNAISTFSSLFSRETQENIYSDVSGLRSGTVTQNGDVWTWQNGSSRIIYDSATGELTEGFGVGGSAKISGLGHDDWGNIYYQKLTYNNVNSEGATLTQIYEQGRLREWSYGFEGQPILTLKCNDSKACINQNDSINNGVIEIYSAPIEIEGPKPYTFDNFILRFHILQGNIAEASVEAKPKKVFTTDEDKRLDEELYVLVNGINADATQVYMQNLGLDLARQSLFQVDPIKDIITPAVFNPGGTLGIALNLLFQNDSSQLQSAIQIIDDIFKIINEQKAGLGELARQVEEAITSFGNINGSEQLLRNMVGVGYSGGFVPLVDAMNKEGHKVASLISLGGSTLAIGTLMAKAITNLVQHMEKIATAREEITRDSYKAVFDVLGVLLKQMPGSTLIFAGINQFLGFLDAFYDSLNQINFNQKVEDMYLELRNLIQQMTRFEWGPIHKAGFVVNVWGSEDPLAKIGITGYKNNIGGYSTSSLTKPLINIEIEGADHFDYVRGIDLNKTEKELENNIIVSSYVANIILNSDNPEKLRTYLDRLINEGRAIMFGFNDYKLVIL